MIADSTFDELVEEGLSVTVDGWDFSWFAGRAVEERPPWGYQRLVAERLPDTRRLLDLQTGGGEVTSGALQMSKAHPERVVATESWPPNVAIARSALAPWHGEVIECADADVPVEPGTFDLLISRHPVLTPWVGVARAMAPGGSYLSQQVGRGSVRELTEAMIGPYEIGAARNPDLTAAEAEHAGLTVTRLETASLPMAFSDIAAIIVFLRKVIWIVPEFSVERYRHQLRTLHEHVQRNGPFRATAERFLIECRKP